MNSDKVNNTSIKDQMKKKLLKILEINYRILDNSLWIK